MADSISSQIREWELGRKERLKKQYAPYFYGQRLLTEGEKKRQQDLATYNAINEQAKLKYGESFDTGKSFEEARKMGISNYANYINSLGQRKEVEIGYGKSIPSGEGTLEAMTRFEKENQTQDFINQYSNKYEKGEKPGYVRDITTGEEIPLGQAQRIVETRYTEPKPTYFRDESGNYITGFFDDKTGKYFDIEGNPLDTSNLEYAGKTAPKGKTEPKPTYFRDKLGNYITGFFNDETGEYFDIEGNPLDVKNLEYIGKTAPKGKTESKFIIRGDRVYEEKTDPEGETTTELVANITATDATKYNATLDALETSFKDYYNERTGKRHGFLGIKGKWNPEAIVNSFVKEMDLEKQIENLNKFRVNYNIGKPEDEKLKIYSPNDEEEIKEFILNEILPKAVMPETSKPTSKTEDKWWLEKAGKTEDKWWLEK